LREAVLQGLVAVAVGLTDSKVLDSRVVEMAVRKIHLLERLLALPILVAAVVEALKFLVIRLVALAAQESLSFATQQPTPLVYR